MKKRILAYLDFLSKAEIEEMSPEELAYFKEDLLRQIEYFQHERLIHLIVTVLFAVLTFMSLMIAVLGENMNAFTWLLSRVPSVPDLWAAWGAIIEKRSYLPACVLDMAAIGQQFGARWFTAGPRSKAGHPHHPLYLKKDVPLDPFTDLTEYLNALEQRR